MSSSCPTRQLERATRFLYLNRTAFAETYRENQAGVYNVPFGGNTDRLLVHETVLKSAAEVLRSATLRVTPFYAVRNLACAGDFVYFDPPYAVGDQPDTFRRYSKTVFTWPAQRRLAALAQSLATGGTDRCHRHRQANRYDVDDARLVGSVTPEAGRVDIECGTVPRTRRSDRVHDCADPIHRSKAGVVDQSCFGVAGNSRGGHDLPGDARRDYRCRERRTTPRRPTSERE